MQIQPLAPTGNYFQNINFLIHAYQNDDLAQLRHYDQQVQQAAPAVLAQLLVISIDREFDPLYSVISQAQQYAAIPANGEWGLGRILVKTVEKQDPDSLHLITQHPNFQQIDANGEWGLATALRTYLAFLHDEQFFNPNPPVPNPEYLEEVIRHPNVREIDPDDDISAFIGRLLLILILDTDGALDAADERLITALLHRDIAHLVNSNGNSGLSRVLINAAYVSSPEIVNAVLQHPGAPEIEATPYDEEEDGEWDDFAAEFEPQFLGWEEALFATFQPASSEEAKFTIAKALIDFATGIGFSFSEDEAFGIHESLTAAAGISLRLVDLILELEASNDIAANAESVESGGLSTALYNAALEGNADIIERLRNHPNAHEIDPEHLESARNIAKKEKHDSALQALM